MDVAKVKTEEEVACGKRAREEKAFRAIFQMNRCFEGSLVHSDILLRSWFIQATHLLYRDLMPSVVWSTTMRDDSRSICVSRLF